MVGGTKEAVAVVEPALLTLAPEGGYAHVGPVGAGHFVKMVHNGIEYGLMQAYAEGFEIMGKADEFDLDLHEIASIWRYGSVVRSWLLDLAERALRPGAGFDEIKGVVVDSGEGRWTAQEAIDRGVPAPVIATSLFTRFASQEPDSLPAQDALRPAQPVRRPRRDARVGPAGPGDRDPDALTAVACSPRSTTSPAPSATRCARPSRRAPGPRFALVLSGGPTARGVLRGAGRRPAASTGALVDVYVGDERVVPPDDVDANQRLIRESLLDRVGAGRVLLAHADGRPGRRVRGRLPAHHVGPGDRAGDRPDPPGHGPRRAHGLPLPGRAHASRPSPASWSLATEDPNGVNPHPRLTLTLPAINSARLAVFTVAGASQGRRRGRAASAATTCRPPASTPGGRCGWSTAPRRADAP